jgi:hypothetical protein
MITRKPTFNDAALNSVAQANYSANVYEAISNFRHGVADLETELIARWKGMNGNDHEKLERVQRMTTAMYSLVGKQFEMSRYDSLRNTSDFLAPTPKVEEHFIDELDMFGMINKTGESTWTLNSLGKMMIGYMYDEYVAKLQGEAKPTTVPAQKTQSPDPI